MLYMFTFFAITFRLSQCMEANRVPDLLGKEKREKIKRKLRQSDRTLRQIVSASPTEGTLVITTERLPAASWKLHF